MKTYKAFALGLVVTATSAFGQVPFSQQSENRAYFSTTASYRNVDVAKVSRNYVATLSSDNDGAVESALAQVTHMRIVLQLANLSSVEAAAKKLAVSGRTPMVRYKSYLAGIVFSNPRMYADMAKTAYCDGDQFFGEIASRVNQALLGYNSK